MRKIEWITEYLCLDCQKIKILLLFGIQIIFFVIELYNQWRTLNIFVGVTLKKISK